jgi:hypothetical protein
MERNMLRTNGDAMSRERASPGGRRESIYVPVICMLVSYKSLLQFT